MIFMPFSICENGIFFGCVSKKNTPDGGRQAVWEAVEAL